MIISANILKQHNSKDTIQILFGILDLKYWKQFLLQPLVARGRQRIVQEMRKKYFFCLNLMCLRSQQ